MSATPPLTNRLHYDDVIKLVDQRLPLPDMSHVDYQQARNARDVAYRAIRVLDVLGYEITVRAD